MNKENSKKKILALILISTFFGLFGFVGDTTNWFFRPIRCYLIDNERIKILEDGQGTEPDFCIHHVYSPYQEKTGSIKLGITSRLTDKNILYTVTTFWMAENIGKSKFSDVKGDFGTDSLALYNQQGIKMLDTADLKKPDDKDTYDQEYFIQQCPNVPIYLNAIHFDDQCIDLQQLIWTEVKNISKDQFNTKRILISKAIPLWISENPYKVVGIIILAIAVTRIVRLISITNFKSELKQSLSVKNILTALHKDRIKLLNFSLISATLISLGFVVNNTTFLKPADLLCLDPQFAQKDNQLNVQKIHSICINEVLNPYNAWSGTVELGLRIIYNDKSQLITESTFFVYTGDEFEDSQGDILHVKQVFYGPNGVLNGDDSQAVYEQLVNLMPPAASNALWDLVKNKLANKDEIAYLSVQRIFGDVIKDSLPFMMAAITLLYSYSLYLSLVFPKNDNEKNKDQPL